MNMSECIRELEGITKVYTQEPMKEHTTFKIGGNADVYILPETEDKLIKSIEICKEHNVPFMIIGNGSNLLVSDDGIEGVVISTENLSDLYVYEETKIYSASGNMLSKTANFAAANSLSGLEFAAGIPGSVGGGIFMNAGAYGGELKDCVISVRVYIDGEICEYPADKCCFGYRESVFQKNSGVILGVKFGLSRGNIEEIKALAADFNGRRRDKQPLEYPSAGSTFKRPEGYFAGKLIEDAGLKGFCIGGACVSEKHSGFIINKGNATATDVLGLVAYVKEEVKKQFGVELEEEVKITGR